MEYNAKPRPLYTVTEFCKRHPAWTQSAMRGLLDKARTRMSSRGPVAGNGLDMATVRVGRRILIDEEAFFKWIAQQNRERELRRAA